MTDTVPDAMKSYEIPKDFDIRIVNHPVIAHKLTSLRSEKTEPPEFRRLLHELTYLLTYEAMRNAPVEKVVVKTPLARYDGAVLAKKKIMLIPIMRAGLGMVDAVLELLPMACVGHI
ncbi:MAG: uracil phosphoribosyltransferase, partial [Thermoplasmata archaeon]